MLMMLNIQAKPSFCVKKAAATFYLLDDSFQKMFLLNAITITTIIIFHTHKIMNESPQIVPQK